MSNFRACDARWICRMAQGDQRRIQHSINTFLRKFQCSDRPYISQPSLIGGDFKPAVFWATSPDSSLQWVEHNYLPKKFTFFFFFLFVILIWNNTKKALLFSIKKNFASHLFRQTLPTFKNPIELIHLHIRSDFILLRLSNRTSCRYPSAFADLRTSRLSVLIRIFLSWNFWNCFLKSETFFLSLTNKLVLAVKL